LERVDFAIEGLNAIAIISANILWNECGADAPQVRHQNGKLGLNLDRFTCQSGRDGLCHFDPHHRVETVERRLSHF
jgi:hypothetical protein